MISRLLGSFSYVAAVYCGMLLVGWKLPRRKLFWLRAVAGLIVCWAVRLGLVLLVGEIHVGITLNRFLLGTTFLFIFVLCMACTFFCYRCNIWAVLFCGITGYCMQFVTYKVYEFIPLFIFNPDKVVETVLLVVITAALYAVFWAVVLRKTDYRGIYNKHIPQFMVAISIVLLTNYLHVFAGIAILRVGSAEILTYYYILAMLAAAFAVFIEFGILGKNNESNEKIILKQLLSQQREQFLSEKQNIELVNIRCHDVRHQLRELQSGIAPEAMDKIMQAINIYDTKAETGNEALSIALAKYGLYCAQNGVRLTYMVDGTRLNFIPPYELYSLFGNAIENAVHAAEELEEDKRVISISGNVYGNFMNISITNYFDGKLDMDGDLPTNRAENHGFGIKSIKMIAEKYGGRINVQTSNDLFMLNIFIPLQNSAE
ncbi:MAG: GHKL domain-containing protein [Clostridia bacterium]|nr:GHKL domain-containing protein [Clostridia bacterium]